ncbi:MAG: hypothetical protein H7Z40_21930 [Phycisphaerae bacterium]|nr:hypothetical protein [Gemmatimonadaceae bacterium]
MFANRTVKHAVLDSVCLFRQASVRRLYALVATMLLATGGVLSGSTAAAQGGSMLGNDSTGKGNRRLSAQQVAERRKMEALFEQRIENNLFDRLQATDDQRGKMRALKKQLDVVKNQLFKDEIDLRRAMRAELTGASPNDAQLTQLLDKWPALQRRRVEIEEREQKELAKFLQPIQRARFFAFMDEFRRSKQDAQWGRGDRDRNGPGMRGDSTGGRGGGAFRGGGSGGRGNRPPPRDSVIEK